MISVQDNVKCSGVRKTWPWKGYSCGAVPTIFKDGKWWCRHHVPLEEGIKNKH